MGTRRQPRAATSVRIDLPGGDVGAVEIIQSGEHLRMAIFEADNPSAPLIQGELGEEECRALAYALLDQLRGPRPRRA